jgi:hypothetical protein
METLTFPVERGGRMDMEIPLLQTEPIALIAVPAQVNVPAAASGISRSRFGQLVSRVVAEDIGVLSAMDSPLHSRPFGRSVTPSQIICRPM